MTLGFLCLMSTVCLAKPVSDTTGAYSVEVPDNWKAATDARGMGLANSNWFTSPDGKHAVAVGSAPIKAAQAKLSLDDFAKVFGQLLAKQGFQGSITAATIAGQDARVIQSVDSKGSRSALLVTRKDKTIAATILISGGQTEVYTSCLNQIANGFHWLK